MPKSIEQVYEEMTGAVVLIQMHTKELVQGIRQLNKERQDLKDSLDYYRAKYDPPKKIDMPAIDPNKFAALQNELILFKSENERLQKQLDTRKKKVMK